MAIRSGAAKADPSTSRRSFASCPLLSMRPSWHTFAPSSQLVAFAQSVEIAWKLRARLLARWMHSAGSLQFNDETGHFGGSPCYSPCVPSDGIHRRRRPAAVRSVEACPDEVGTRIRQDTARGVGCECSGPFFSGLGNEAQHRCAHFETPLVDLGCHPKASFLV